MLEHGGQLLVVRDGDGRVRRSRYRSSIAESAAVRFMATVVRSGRRRWCERFEYAASDVTQSGRGDEHDLVGAPGGEPRERPDHAGPEIEQHDLVEAGEQRHQLAVPVRLQPHRVVRLAPRGEHMQPGR